MTQQTADASGIWRESASSAPITVRSYSMPASPIPAAPSDVAGQLHTLWLELNDAHAAPPATARILNVLIDAAAALRDISHDREVMREALGKIAHPEYGIGFNRLRGIARAALASLKGGA